jgi:hypothetical protein
VSLLGKRRSTYEVLTRQMVSDLADELREFPCYDAENDRSYPLETPHDTATDQFPYPWSYTQCITVRQVTTRTRTVVRGGHARRRGTSASRRDKRKAGEEEGRFVHVWTLLLEILGGLVTLGTIVGMVYEFVEWLRRLLGG